jgi:hypothetical protein
MELLPGERSLRGGASGADEHRADNCSPNCRCPNTDWSSRVQKLPPKVS